MKHMPRYLYFCLQPKISHIEPKKNPQCLQ